MDLWIFVMVFALIYFLSSGIQNRRKERRQAEERQETEDAPQVPQETHDAVDRAAEAGYDYGEFRKKLRQAWKLPAPSGPQEETKAEDQVYKEAERPEERKSVPVTVRKEERKAPAPAAGPRPRTAADVYNEEQRRRWQQYAEENGSLRADEPVHRVAVTAEPVRKVWTEKDAEQWIRYDAVFGEPRSKKAWSPIAGARGGRRYV